MVRRGGLDQADQALDELVDQPAQPKELLLDQQARPALWSALVRRQLRPCPRLSQGNTFVEEGQ